ncbi:tRNA uridine-5-carboxymethylaminomethyl(34) synthesis GTPase MnmE [Pseudoblastomonas halimionae]|uniref:tRNA modification GTPase MnmE n=1 Tax=Alteriqipengyuania halimionae TaxID=1926630 RepID=A0A6I4U415_9SPHN|nr:tRNA uridine-5-carboxymethylaminomethyl(34) synthesis GTPase MnmE [Alteriqipengyuania halimionae]MXP10849.1 tRNA uridine-5-carboxymethylaminomethyl(34) synthesis GTPase MnmE [Alteriqipengyuania halimionae]
MDDTIFALSSGAPPAAIAIVRVSGSRAGEIAEGLSGRKPEPRRAALARLRNREGETLDDALILWFPGPDTATGEDLLELHCHGGRAVVRAVEHALQHAWDCRPAEAGEFTRRAFANGRIDLAQAEALGDLLSAESELQRRVAVRMAGGAASARVEDWRERLLILAAQIEAALDFSDEDDVADLSPAFSAGVATLAAEIGEWLARPAAERLREGIRIALAGPPNSGKSSLFNRLLDEEAAIATPIEGTTRDLLERPIAWGGVPFTLIDTAGLRDTTDDAIEAIGIERARSALADADIVLWLGPKGEGPRGAWEIETKSDLDGPGKHAARHRVSAVNGEGVLGLQTDLVASARDILPKPGETALNARQRAALMPAEDALLSIENEGDHLLIAENLRRARVAFDAFTGRAASEDVLDRLFGQFCIGK